MDAAVGVVLCGFEPEMGSPRFARHFSFISSIARNVVNCLLAMIQSCRLPRFHSARSALTPTEPPGNAIRAATSSRNGVSVLIVSGDGILTLLRNGDSQTIEDTLSALTRRTVGHGFVLKFGSRRFAPPNRPAIPRQRSCYSCQASPEMASPFGKIFERSTMGTRKPNGAGKDPTIGFRLPAAMVKAIDELARGLRCNRSNAARLVIDLGLKSVRRSDLRAGRAASQ
jgi:hypothetical protein